MQHIQNKNKIIAAHRGLSSLYPENTLEGFLAALEFSDFVEMDVVLCKDEVIVSHDTFLSRLSDIHNYPQYNDRKCKRIYKKEEMDDWWMMDFTYQELSQFTLHQAILNRKSEYDWKCRISTLRNVLSQIIEYNQKHNQQKGVLLEIKEYNFHKEYLKRDITEFVLPILNELNLLEEGQTKLPLLIMAFDQEILFYCQQNAKQIPRVQLLRQDDLIRPTLEEISGYSQILGVDLRLLYDHQLHESTGFGELAQEKGFLVFGWTFQDDNEELMIRVKNQNLYKLFGYLNGYDHQIQLDTLLSFLS